jgi:hypothetical protein
MALRDRQTGWQGSLGWKAASPDAFNRLSSLDRSFVKAGHREPRRRGSFATPSTRAAAKAGMDAKTARKYHRLGRLPSKLASKPRGRTRPDPFAEVWEEVREHLEINPGLEAKTVFEHLQRRYPRGFHDGQLRTRRRRVKHWRATEAATDCDGAARGAHNQPDGTAVGRLEQMRCVLFWPWAC